jgi:hypothetical protein
MVRTNVAMFTNRRLGRPGARVHHGSSDEIRRRRGTPRRLPALETLVAVWSRTRFRRPHGSMAVLTELVGHEAHGPVPERFDLDHSFSRDELGPFTHRLRAELRCGPLPLDSPARLEEALGRLVHSLGGDAEISVVRSPAALLTPEYWRVHIAGVDSNIHATLEEVMTGEWQ